MDLKHDGRKAQFGTGMVSHGLHSTMRASIIQVDGDCSHEIKRYLLLVRKANDKPRQCIKNRDVTLLTKVCIVKATLFPVVMYRCKSWTIKKVAAAAAKSLQSCPTLCDPTDGSPPGSPVTGILQERTLEWVAISFFSIIFHY